MSPELIRDVLLMADPLPERRLALETPMTVLRRASERPKAERPTAVASSEGKHAASSAWPYAALACAAWRAWRWA